ncbi:hypothetical protein H4R18_005794 [Coemansia javaensis]|uniref:Myb-like domain-containing protein n=1 Tax=Coemansia javaensis TaxID=2761396 RepID=A0A9W8H1D8_9FUNG|nr:hypothetical protein H4R18_005794 [Coemansia javaensis]
MDAARRWAWTAADRARTLAAVERCRAGGARGDWDAVAAAVRGLAAGVRSQAAWTGAERARLVARVQAGAARRRGPIDWAAAAAALGRSARACRAEYYRQLAQRHVTPAHPVPPAHLLPPPLRVLPRERWAADQLRRLREAAADRARFRSWADVARHVDPAGGRTPAACSARAHQLRIARAPRQRAPAAAAPGAAPPAPIHVTRRAWAAGETARLRAAVRDVPRGAGDRWAAVARRVGGGRTRAQCIARARTLGLTLGLALGRRPQ